MKTIIEAMEEAGHQLYGEQLHFCEGEMKIIVTTIESMCRHHEPAGDGEKGVCFVGTWGYGAFYDPRAGDVEGVDCADLCEVETDIPFWTRARGGVERVQIGWAKTIYDLVNHAKQEHKVFCVFSAECDTIEIYVG